MPGALHSDCAALVVKLTVKCDNPDIQIQVDDIVKSKAETIPNKETKRVVILAEWFMASYCSLKLTECIVLQIV